MKCLSLWQPHATLMAIGAKLVETRWWSTDYRGPLAIHAAKKWSRALERLCFEPPFLAALRENESDADHQMIGRLKAAMGHILCVVDLEACIGTRDLNRAKIEEAMEDCRDVGHATAVVKSEREYAFGDYTPGRFAWLTSRLRKFPTPIPFVGHQGLFNVPDELIERAFGDAV